MLFRNQWLLFVQLMKRLGVAVTELLSSAFNVHTGQGGKLGKYVGDTLNELHIFVSLAKAVTSPTVFLRFSSTPQVGVLDVLETVIERA